MEVSIIIKKTELTQKSEPEHFSQLNLENRFLFKFKLRSL